MITAEEAREYFNYNPETGWLTRRNKTGKKGRIGARVGVNADRRRNVGFRGKHYKEHRIIWLWVHGEWPALDIDHVNGDGCDNRLCNLRLATKSQNMANTAIRKHNRQGFKGIAPNGKRWVARIRHNCKTHYIGSYDTKEAAHAAYAAEARRRFGEFSRAA